MVNFRVRVVHLVTQSPCVLFVLCLFVILFDSHFGFKGKTLVVIVPVPDHCNFLLYGQTLFAIIFLNIFNTNK